MPKAYVDDSGRRDHSSVFVLAGWAASTTTWNSFSEDWQQVLELKPPLEYFKAYDAARLRGQFAYFSRERSDERVRLLCDVLDKYAPTQLSCVVILPDFDKVMSEISAPRWARNPFYIAFWQLLETFAHNQRGLHMEDKVDFVFDDQAEQGRIAEGWDSFVENAHPAIRPLIGVEPVFLSDLDVKPLQAADLFAWHTRAWNEQRIADPGKNFVPDLPLVRGVYQGVSVRLDEPYLRNLFGAVRS